ncbi:ABC transporter ATP-binding protein [Sungkyunkwania multivorans]|uniref:ABC transporter ATP-binding protein n=1 Tax=Sungkyunkwania multivorans TaxID=1173618 RepID=A0ABW3D313_9FLAO
MLNVQNISFAYDNENVINDISFSMRRGECLAILGESGCGKSTLIKTIYGLYNLTDGSIFWGEKQLLGPNFNIVPGEDFIKYVAQDFDLMPFATVEENVGKFLSNFYRKEKAKRTAQLLETIGLSAYAKTTPKYLSGGQQQRIAIARALAKDPELLLLDEPFGQIDNFKKNELRRNLFSFLKENNISCILASHDSTDALSYADRIIVMKDGKIIADDTPQHLYNDPKTLYIASLFGEANVLPYLVDDKEVLMLVYPHEINIDDSSKFKMTVTKCYFRGDHFLVEGIMNDRPVFIKHSAFLEAGNVTGFSLAKHVGEKRILS